MKSKSKRLLSTLLVVVMAVGLFDAMPFTAYAADQITYTTHPESKTVTEGDTVSFTYGYQAKVSAGGFETHHWQYQAPGSSTWYQFENDYAARVLTLTATAAMNGYKIRHNTRTASNQNFYSNTATLTVISKAPSITSHPESKTTSGAASFSVSAMGTGTLTYQWYVKVTRYVEWAAVTNGGVYSGATSPTLSLSGSPGGSTELIYHCVVTNKSGTCQAAAVKSWNATLEIPPPPPPPPPSITTHPRNRRTVDGSTVTFSVTASSSSGAAVSYQWQVYEDVPGFQGWVDITSSSAFFSGFWTSTLTVSNYQYDPYNPQDNVVRLRCAASNSGGTTYSNEAKLTAYDAQSWDEILWIDSTTIDQQPQDSSVIAGQSTSFYIDASNATSYRWYYTNTSSSFAMWSTISDGGVYSGATTDTLTLTDVPASYNGYRYLCEVRGLFSLLSGASISSSPATLTVTEASGTLAITGTSGMTLSAGYESTSTAAYIVSIPSATVTKTSGDSAITWNNGTKKLDVAAGLGIGEYPVVLTATSGSNTATFTFTLTVAEATSPPMINGSSGMTLNTGYEATSTDDYNITGAPTPTVTLDNTHGGKITWNNGAKKLDIAAGLGTGTYAVVLKATNSEGEVTLAFTLVIQDAGIPPDIEGTAGLTLAAGYAATSSGAFVVTGDPEPTVTKTSGDAKITWNDTTAKLDIAPGLTPGTYQVILKAENGIDPDAEFTFTVTVTASAAIPFPFTDVFQTDWYYNDVKSAWEMGLINGKTDTLFMPADELTYAEAVKLAACMHQLYTTGTITLTNGSPDWYQSYVDYAKAAGIINKDYAWNTPATRAGYMEIFANALPDAALAAVNTVPDGAIPDVPATHPQAAAIYKLYRAGIVQGMDTATHACAPESNILRREVATILTRMMDPAARISFSM